ncbi:hypothetical protein CXF83_15170 [Shewanella sp. Choline-02u-19]|uniref:hypothetical protein n=1 Tax=unclassified Shewanella TaxID=196818 RepID=UPI000C3454AD|nr:MULTISPECIES: hypothetical protein [unclassified Shewanella]PKH56537.1 hypothetical protein CXF84_13175 [Shewanella sp. Bg11-22]PKI27957.1 hypothetical protein CXF83_15170 [Shewanella sp. Choline-02u-19]
MKYIKKIPILGPLVSIINSYVYNGADEASTTIAPFGHWFRKLGANIVTAVALSALFIGYFDLGYTSFPSSDIALAIFPSILGFGIGVYALLFSIQDRLIAWMEGCHSIDELPFGPKVLISDMAYPLIVYVFVLLISGINKAFAPAVIEGEFIGSFLLFYGLLVTLELIITIYTVSDIMFTLKVNDIKKDRLTPQIEPRKNQLSIFNLSRFMKSDNDN